MSNRFANLFSGLIASAFVWNLGAASCSAHPDHPVQIVSSESLLHYLVQPEHALPLAVFAVAMWWISLKFSPRLMARVPAKKNVHVEDSGRS
jgi:hypothetical protein